MQSNKPPQNHFLVLIRHGESLWNQQNRFTCWKDVELSEKGIKEAEKDGKHWLEENIKADVAYTGGVTRAIRTVMWILSSWNMNWL